MAVKDIRKYYQTMQAQYLSMKQTLADANEALANGYFTEERVADLKQRVELIEQNYNRISYIIYLLDMPNRNTKKKAYNRQNKKKLAELKTEEADLDSVKKENAEAINEIKDKISSFDKASN